MRLGLKAVEKAIESDGVREIPLGSNWGKFVQVYLASVGIKFPAAWCAAFVFYKIIQAAAEEKLKFDWPKTGYVPTIASWAKQNNRFLDKPIPGCVFLVPKFNLAGVLIGWRHVGFVDTVKDDGTITTVEGNTNDDGSSNGIGVFRLTRIARKLRFVRIEP